MSDFNSNAFTQQRVPGQLDLRTNPNPAVYTVRYAQTATSTDRIVPGEGTKLVDLGGDDNNGPPIVNKRTDDGDAIFGVRIFNPEKNQKAPADLMQVAGQGAVIFMEAAAAANRGVNVALVTATPGRVATRTTEEILGIQLDKSTALGDVVRVLITARGFSELALYELST